MALKHFARRSTVRLLLVLLVPLACSREAPPASWFEPQGGSSKAGSPSVATTPDVRASGPFVSCESAPVNPLIRVDQFGYRPEAKKVAVLVDPVTGWNEPEQLKPGAVYEVRSWQDGKLAFSGAPRPWNNGSVHAGSGDRGFWFDFSALGTDGSYCIVDRERGFRSHRFDINRQVYRDVLKAATRMFYFQRANFAKVRPFACVKEKCWTASADYVGAGQDREARSVTDRGNAKTARDLSGGWWDAGDTNKYVTFAHVVIHQLLAAYRERPQAFGDDVGIPESGNGVPDLLDEVKVELDWLRRMQPSDLGGGVLIKVGNVEHGDPIPEKSRFPRFYYPAPCSASTISAAGNFAHAALVLRNFAQLKSYADDLKTRAVSAWQHYHQHPKSAECDNGTIKSGDADKTLGAQDQAATVAVIYLYALTAEASYAQAIAKGYTGLQPMQEDRWSAYNPDQGDALLFYSSLPGADAAIKSAILERKLTQSKTVDLYGFRPEADLYRAYQRPDSFHWGHNMVAANVGSTNYDLLQFGLVKGDGSPSVSERAAGILHGFHGVNALGIVYLTNMYAYGAESSVNQIYHAWFRDGDSLYDDAKQSTLGPPPGYVPGGPNPQYCAGQDAAQNKCASSRLRKQPPQKAFLDFNTGWDPKQEHDRSWEITEPGIYYQSAYVKLLSKFVD